jgi:hypothetical protein
MKIKEILEMFEVMGIKDVTTDRQRKNGTTVFEIPFEKHKGHKMRFAEYSTGYVRSLNAHSPYQLNKKVIDKTYVHEWGKYHTHKRKLIPKRKHRLQYLFKFLLKNYYSKIHVEKIPVYRDRFHEQSISVVVDGHKYKIQ